MKEPINQGEGDKDSGRRLEGQKLKSMSRGSRSLLHRDSAVAGDIYGEEARTRTFGKSDRAAEEKRQPSKFDERDRVLSTVRGGGGYL